MIARKLPSGSYRAQASKMINGRSVRKSFTAKTKRAAEMAALEWQNDIIYEDNLTLEQACIRYIDTRRNIASPVTVKTYEAYTRRYLQSIMSLPLRKITEFNLQSIFNEMAITLSPKTLKSVYGFFRAVFLQNKINITITLPKLEKVKYNTPDIATCKQILQLVENTDLAVPVNLAMRCGLRLSEICGLKYCNVNKDKIYIDNVKTVYGSEVFEKKPKSVAGTRQVPLPSDIKKMIDALPHDSDYIENRRASALSIAFSRFLVRNGMPKIKFHELRHAFASVMALAGVPERYAMSIGGWDTADVMHSIYEQTFADKQTEFAKRIDSYFG